MIVLDRNGRCADPRPVLEPRPRLLVLLDRDGTIVQHRRGHVLSVDDAVYLPGALDALRELASLDVAAAIVTNQSAVARGLIGRDELLAIHRRILADAAAAGSNIFASFICPHGPDDHCACRKPAPAMVATACDTSGIPAHRTVLIGDAYSDVAAAIAAGATPILVATGLGREARARLRDEGNIDVVVRPSLHEAVGDVRRLLAADASRSRTYAQTIA